MQPSPRHSRCATSLDTTNSPNFSLPEALLEQSMSKYEREARERLQLSQLVEEITMGLQEVIEQLLHDRIYSEITRVVNEVLCLREEVTLFSREGTVRQDQAHEALRAEIRTIRRRLDDLAAKKNALTFQSAVKESRQAGGEGVEGLVREVYEFMQKNEASRVMREWEGRVERLEEQLRHSNAALAQKIEQAGKHQKPINENLRKQLNDALSKDAIAKEIKKALKENIRYLFDELVRSRKDIDELRDHLKALADRQRDLEFSQTLLEHKLA